LKFLTQIGISSFFLGCILGLLFLLVISVIVITARGESEKNCVEYASPHLVIIGQRSNFGETMDGCDWLVDKLLWNGTGLHISFYSYHDQITGHSTMIGAQRFVMTK
jgi:hypothetical protein